MGLKQLLRRLAAGVLAAASLEMSAAAASASAVVSAALAEVGYTEGAREYTKYGQWYGLPNSYWCDMFVSWCASKGGVPQSGFPRNCSCSAHVRQFADMGCYQDSAARGGSYVPQPGDVIFFYNYLRYPTGSVKNHTGLVLYVEDGYVYTIEGNALANRLDIWFSEIVEFEDGDLEPPDYVVVNRYPLDYPRIHGYGVPKYDDRTAPALEGFVDLGTHKDKAAVFEALCGSGIMQPTSSHTFSPGHGMPRSEFITMTVKFFGLEGYAADTQPFDDVPAGIACYEQVLAARSAGLLADLEGNSFQPSRYVSAGEAQGILNRALEYVGLSGQEFLFSEGDYSYMVSPYTTRADIAQAFDGLCKRLPLTESFAGKIVFQEKVMNWPARMLNGICYVPAASLREVCPELKLPSDTGALPKPLGTSERVAQGFVRLQNGQASAELAGFTYQGTPYVSLWAAAPFLSLNAEWKDEGGGTVLLTARETKTEETTEPAEKGTAP